MNDVQASEKCSVSNLPLWPHVRCQYTHPPLAPGMHLNHNHSTLLDIQLTHPLHPPHSFCTCNTPLPPQCLPTPSLGKAVEDAVNGVFIASLKMGAFYGMWTWLLHSLFNVNIVYIPSGEWQDGGLETQHDLELAFG